MTFERLVVATRNPGKLAEWRILLRPWARQLVTPDEVTLPEVDETRDDYVGNAVLKAESGRRASSLPAIADDTGIEIDALGGGPGVHTRRYIESHGGWGPAQAHLAASLGLARGRVARATACCAVALARPGGPTLTGFARVPGRLRWPPTPGRSGVAELFCPDGPSPLERGGVFLHRRLAFEQLCASWPSG